MSKLIMVVDDSAMIRTQVRRALVGAGFQVVQATDGQDGWEKLTSDVALVVCDVNMPRMNGLEFVEQVRHGPEYKRLPIVMLTTEGRPDMIRQARKLGCKAWMVKPFKPSLLISAVEKILAATV